MKLNELDEETLEALHNVVLDLRRKVLDLEHEYGYSACSLVSRVFEHDIEMEYGRRRLKRSFGK